MILLLLLAGAGYVTYKVFLAPSAPPGSAFRDRMAALSDLDQIFNTPSETERFADPIYTCFGSNIIPAAMARGRVDPATGLWEETLAAEEGLAGGAGVLPYEIVPNRFGIGGIQYAPVIWTEPSAGYFSTPNAATFPIVAAHETPVNDYKFGVGYEYLGSVKASAASRVGAMRAKVNAFAAARGKADFAIKPATTTLEAFAKESYAQISTISSSVLDTLENEDNYPKIAQAAGITPAEVKARANYVIGLAKESVANTKIVSEAAGVISPISDAISSTVKSALSGAPPEASLLEFVANVAKWIPVYGQVIELGAKLLQGFVLANAASAAREASDMCQAWINAIHGNVETISKNLLPIPWHALSTFNATTCSNTVYPTFDQQAVLTTLETNTKFFTPGTGLTARDVRNVQRWWMLSATFMSDERVYDVFDALGRDIYGGTVASDEQVMLVAVPIAVASGLPDADDFAKRLWARSVGWQGADKPSFVDIGFEPDVCNGPTTRNAWWLQWAALARDAFELLDELKGRTPPTSVLGDPRTLQKLDIGRIVDAGLGDKIGPIVTTPKAPKPTIRFIARSGLK